MLDGLYKNSKYWHDTRTPLRTIKRREAGMSGIMMWAGESARGAIKLMAIQNKFNTVKYSEVLEEGLIPFIEDKYGASENEVILQQDGAPARTVKFTQE